MWPEYPSSYGYDRWRYDPYPSVPYRPPPAKKTIPSFTINKEKNKMTTVKQQREAHAADIALITQKMKDLAEKHSFCDVFTNAVDELNVELSMPIELNKRGKGDVVLTVTISYSDLGLDDVNEMGDEHFSELIDAITDAIKSTASDNDATLNGSYAVNVEYEGSDLKTK